MVEYEALFLELRVATSLGKKRVKILGDSLQIISQVNKEWTCNDVNMMAYCQEIRKLENNIEGISLSRSRENREGIEYGHIYSKVAVKPPTS